MYHFTCTISQLKIVYDGVASEFAFARLVWHQLTLVDVWETPIVSTIMRSMNLLI